MNLSEKRGISVEGLKQTYLRSLARPERTVRDQLFGGIQNNSGLAVLLLLSGRTSEAHTYAACVVDRGIEYFLGDWSHAWEQGIFKYDRSDFRKQVWQPEMLEAFAWAVALDRWDDAKKLLDFVGPDLGDYTEPDRKAFWIALRDFVSGKPKDDFVDWLARSRKAKSKSHELVQAAFDALVDGDAPAFQQSLLAQFTAYAKRHRKPQGFPDAFNWWGSILFHFARHRGISAALPEFESEFLLTLNQPTA